MGNRDINLFKAAGGERAKSTKRSPVSYVALVTLVLIVVAIGVMVYFNLQANTAESDLADKQDVLFNYQNTKMNITAVRGDRKISLADEYKMVRDDLDAAAVINSYIDESSALYPKASVGETDAVKELLLGQGYEFNDPINGVSYDYEGLRNALYADESEVFVENRELFYYALQNLANEQKASRKEGKWFTYYRGYMLVVFTGGSGAGLNSVCATLFNPNSYWEFENVSSPFSRYDMANADFNSGYSPAKWMSCYYEVKDSEGLMFNMLLMPMKSNIERVFDILEACADDLVIVKNWGDQTALAAYGVDNIHFTNKELTFDLVLYAENFNSFMHALDNSDYFKVDDSVILSKGEELGGDYALFNVVLLYEYEVRSDTTGQ